VVYVYFGKKEGVSFYKEKGTKKSEALLFDLRDVFSVKD